MRHLDEGILRRLIDEPQAASDTARQHLASCAVCRTRQDELAATAGELGALFALPPYAASTAAAWERVRPQLAGSRRIRFGRQRRLLRPLGGLAAAAALVGAVTLTPAGSWAQSFVTVFQPQQVVIVPVSLSELRHLPKLAHFGTVTAPRHVPSRQVSTAADAARYSGYTVLTPGWVPGGTPTNVSYQVISGGQASFTFQAARAAAWARTHHQTLPPVPAQLDDSTLHLTVQPAVIALYGGNSSFPALTIGQMRSPTITSDRASVSAIERFVLSLPSVPPQLADQLRSIQNPSSTLPIPVPINIASASTVTVQGVQGVVLGDSTGIGSVVFWVKDGMMYGVGGTLTQDQALRVANSLH